MSVGLNGSAVFVCFLVLGGEGGCCFYAFGRGDSEGQRPSRAATLSQEWHKQETPPGQTGLKSVLSPFGRRGCCTRLCWAFCSDLCCWGWVGGICGLGSGGILAGWGSRFVGGRGAAGWSPSALPSSTASGSRCLFHHQELCGFPLSVDPLSGSQPGAPLWSPRASPLPQRQLVCVWKKMQLSLGCALSPSPGW